MEKTYYGLSRYLFINSTLHKPTHSRQMLLSSRNIFSHFPALEGVANHSSILTLNLYNDNGGSGGGGCGGGGSDDDGGGSGGGDDDGDGGDGGGDDDGDGSGGGGGGVVLGVV